jgi:hypothetical protein
MGEGKIGAFRTKCQSPDAQKMQISGKRLLDFGRRRKFDDSGQV